MKTWLKFTFAGLAYALVIEFEYKLFAHFNPQALFITAIFYIIFPAIFISVAPPVVKMD